MAILGSTSDGYFVQSRVHWRRDPTPKNDPLSSQIIEIMAGLEPLNTLQIMAGLKPLNITHRSQRASCFSGNACSHVRPPFKKNKALPCFSSVVHKCVRGSSSLFAPSYFFYRILAKFPILQCSVSTVIVGFSAGRSNFRMLHEISPAVCNLGHCGPTLPLLLPQGGTFSFWEMDRSCIF